MMVVKRKAFQMAALVAAGSIVLLGCSGQGTDEQDVDPQEDATSTASPTAPSVDLDQYAQALVTDAELMGAPEDPPVEGFVDEPVSMYLTLSDFNPTGECEELLDELNSYSGPAVAGISAKFVKEVPPSNGDAEQSPEATEASAQTLIFETVNSDEPMSIYRQIPNACDTLTSDEVEDAEAVFTKVPGLDALHLEIFDGQETETLAVGGSSVNGTYHAYMSAEQVSMEQAQEMFGAQAEKLQETFQDEASASPSPQDEDSDAQTSDEPTAD
ncbi:MAG TPA: hypothetical protein H9822_04360 [Candidatus Yaniella excrementavium]|nr:hypothetical protein [Candidatus Yaniella excrementavium]